MKFAILTLMLTASMATALEWNTAIQYVAKDDPTARWILQDDGQGVYIRQWKSTVDKPTKAQLEAIEADAIAWSVEKKKTEESDIEKMEAQMKAVIKALVKVVNLRLPADKKISQAEMVAAIKAEL